MNHVHRGAVNALRFGRRTLVAAVVLTLCAVVALAAATVVRGADDAAEAALASGSGLRQIDLEAPHDDPGARRLTGTALDGVRALEGVDSVEPLLQASFDSGTDESLPPFLLHATIERPSLRPPLLHRSRDAVFPLRGREVVLPAVGDGQDLTGLLGRTVAVAHTRRTGENRGTAVADRITVVGLYDPAWRQDGPNAAYAAAPLVVEWAAAREGVSPERFLATRGFSGATVVVARPEAVAPVLERLHRDRFSARAVADRVRDLPLLLELFRWGSWLMLGLLGAVAAAAGVGMGGTLLRERIHEVGLLRAVGHTRRQVLTAFAVEAGCLGLAAGAAGALLGSALGALAVRGLRGLELFARHLPPGLVLPGPWTVAATLLLPAAAVLAGAAGPLRRAVRTDPVRALRAW
ncbi:FtsX-like permease family protein [Streptomyces sanyensis]|uniref:FtsX-like permease family protein n=1 Tax=Streptomyces sanyensis TaxID=568869 RepID=UPI003D78769E